MQKPRYFLENVVQPNVAELAADCASERKAFNAAAAVDALVAALFFWCEANQPARVAGINDDTHFRHHLAGQNSDYALLRDVAKALKHVELRRGTPQVSSAAQVEARSLGWGEARWDEGRWDSPPQVALVTNSGAIEVLESVIHRALAFIEAEMKAAGC